MSHQVAITSLYRRRSCTILLCTFSNGYGVARMPPSKYYIWFLRTLFIRSLSLIDKNTLFRVIGETKYLPQNLKIGDKIFITSSRTEIKSWGTGVPIFVVSTERSTAKPWNINWKPREGSSHEGAVDNPLHPTYLGVNLFSVSVDQATPDNRHPRDKTYHPEVRTIVLFKRMVTNLSHPNVFMIWQISYWIILALHKTHSLCKSFSQIPNRNDYSKR